MTGQSERKLTAILAADVAGYSRHMDRDEEGTVRALRSHLDAVVSIITQHGGHVVNTAGDGILAEFASAIRATEAAIAIQRGMAALDAGVPTEDKLRFRIGINVGDVVAEGSNILGDGVNVAARLEQLAEPGGILISGTAYDNLQGKLTLPIDYVGDQPVKNISRPVRTYSVRIGATKRTWRLRLRPARRYLPVALGLAAIAIAGGAAWWLQPKEQGLLAKPSIAVLPFDNFGGDEATGRFADGITEDIITDLARYREIDVIARNSTFAYKSKPVDIRQIGRDLNVRYVLEGSVQRQSEQVRITAQLIEAATGAHLWSERWDRPIGDFFVVQSDISDQVTNRLVDTNGLILAAEPVGARRVKPGDLTAYELYLQGRELSHRFTKDSLAEAIPILRLAVDKDPTFARGWVELSGAQTTLADFDDSVAVASRDAAWSAIHRAIALDPMDANAHALFGHLLGTRGELERSKVELETALRLAPGSVDVISTYISWASTFGEPQRGADMVDRVLRLDPNYPTWAIGPYSYAYVMAGRYDAALHLLEGRDPENYTVNAWVFRAISNAALGKDGETKVWLKKAMEAHPELTIQGYASGPGWSDAEQARLVETMRKAGFPPCAKAGQLDGVAHVVNLPECLERAKP
jgi:TolB-like protein/class 3 adenylate cyclase